MVVVVIDVEVVEAFLMEIQMIRIISKTAKYSREWEIFPKLLVHRTATDRLSF